VTTGCSCLRSSVSYPLKKENDITEEAALWSWLDVAWRGCLVVGDIADWLYVGVKLLWSFRNAAGVNVKSNTFCENIEETAYNETGTVSIIRKLAIWYSI
jgi:hypothetical protein